jgi:hypothetical protein
MLPVIQVGGMDFYDISGIVTPDTASRIETIGLALHHTVGQTEFVDKNANGTTMDEEIAHIKAINSYHISVGYGGFGYNGIGFMSGRAYVVGPGRGQRAHVRWRNHQLEGFALAGTFTDRVPPLGCQLAAGRWTLAKFKQHGRLLELKGHNAWALASDPSQCPGAGGRSIIHAILRVAEALQNEENELLETAIRRVIENALAPTVREGDLKKLAHQVAWITGGELCGVVGK